MDAYASLQTPLSPSSGWPLFLSTTSTSGTPFGQLLLAVFNSIAQVFLLCAAGYLLAREGVLDKKTQKQINRLNVNLFTPALLFSKVAFYLTPAKLKELWIIPIWFIIVTCSSMLVGRTLGWAAGLRRSQRSFITAASMFMNSNTLPIALMQSLVVSVPDLAWDALNQNQSGENNDKDGGGDNKNAMLGRALTYLTMYSTLGMVVRYSYGVSLLSRADTVSIPVHHDAPQAEASASANDAAAKTKTKLLMGDGDDDEHTPLLLSPEHRRIYVHPPSAGEGELDDEREWVSHPSSSTLVTTHDRDGDGDRDGDNAVPPIIGITSAHGQSQSSHTPHVHEGSLVASPTSIGNGGLSLPLPETVQEGVQETGGMNGINGKGRLPLERPRIRKRTTTFYNSFPNSPNDSRLDLSGSTNETSDEEEEGLPTHNGAPQQTHSNHNYNHTPLARRLLQKLRLCLLAIHTFMTVPLYASLLSLIVACAPPLKHGLEHHMQPLNDAMDQAGKCAVPLTLVVLGGYFYTPSAEGEGVKIRKDKKDKRSLWKKVRDWFRAWKEERARRREEKKGKGRPGETKTIVLAVLSRMVITPLVLLPLMVWATKSDWHVVFDDPVFITTNVILLCSPPALTLAQITAQVSGDAFERLISGTIFWSYCLLTPPVMMGCVLLGLWLVKF